MLNSKLIFALISLLFASFLVPHQAYADQGSKMLALKCDKAHDKLVFQPFIQWNENYHYQGLKLVSPQNKSFQTIDGYQFFSPELFKGKILKIECGLQSRTIKIFLDANTLTIVDIKGNDSWAKEIDLFTEIGSAWNVFGPLYQIRSDKFRQWEECSARGNVAATDTKYTCTPITRAEE